MPAPALVRSITLFLNSTHYDNRVAAMTAFSVSLLHLADKYIHPLSNKRRDAIKQCIEYLHAGKAWDACFVIDEAFHPYPCYANDAARAVYDLTLQNRSAVRTNSAGSAYHAAFAANNAISNGVPADQVQALITLHLT